MRKVPGERWLDVAGWSPGVMFVFDPFNDITDEQLAALPEEHRQLWIDAREARRRKTELIERESQARNFRHVVALADSKERAGYLVDLDERFSFTDDETRDLLTDFWSVTEAWSGDEHLRDGMFGLLKRVAPLYVDGEPPNQAVLTIYRGNLGEVPAPHMMSWTLNRPIAEMFARMGMSIRGKFLGMYREGGIPTVWRAQIRRSDVIGYFNDRDEREVVVDGSDLIDLELIAQAIKPEEEE